MCFTKWCHLMLLHSLLLLSLFSFFCKKGFLYFKVNPRTHSFKVSWGWFVLLSLKGWVTWEIGIKWNYINFQCRFYIENKGLGKNVSIRQKNKIRWVAWRLRAKKESAVKNCHSTKKEKDGNFSRLDQPNSLGLWSSSKKAQRLW